MQNRTMYALLGAALLLVTGVVTAQANDSETNDGWNDGPNYDSNGSPEGGASATRPPPTMARAPGGPAAAFAIKITPGQAWLAPGGTATLAVVAESREDVALKLQARTRDGVAVSLSAESLDLVAGEPARVLLTVTAPDRPSTSPYGVFVLAMDAQGHVSDARAAIHVGDAARAGPDHGPRGSYDGFDGQRPEPTDPNDPDHVCPEGHPMELRAIHDRQRRLIELEGRLHQLAERVEKQLAHLERASAKIESRPSPEPSRAAVRMTLADEHAAVGADGGRVALLFEGGDRGARVQLAIRADPSSGWRVGLEKDVVSVPANQRAWVWVHLAPPAACDDLGCDTAGAGTVEFTIYQVGTPGPYSATGQAYTRSA